MDSETVGELKNIYDNLRSQSIMITNIIHLRRLAGENALSEDNTPMMRKIYIDELEDLYIIRDNIEENIKVLWRLIFGI